jgi:hypothetical protein
MATCALVLQQQVDRVLESAEFSGTRRCQEFLRYVVDRAAAGQLDYLKERVIGNAIFGRSPDYDTGSDAIVRVVANETRKRLHRYYLRGSHAAEPRLELHAGSYLPTFQAADSTSPSPLAETAPEHVADPPSAEFSSRWRRLRKAGWAALAAVLAGLCLWLYSDNSSLRRQMHRSANPAAGILPWSALFAGNRSVHLVLGDGSVGALQVWMKKRLSLTQYISKRFIPDPGSVGSGDAELLDFLARSEFTTVSYATTAVRIAQFAQSCSYPIDVSFAREMSMRTFRGGDHFILIGTARANPFIDLLEQHLNFSLHYEPGEREPVIRNGKPLPGEPATYVPIRDRESYGHVAFLHMLHQSGHVLLVGGTNSQATEATGEFITDVARLRDFLGRIGLASGGPVRSFEILLKVGHTNGAPVECEPVAHRVIANLN